VKQELLAGFGLGGVGMTTSRIFISIGLCLVLTAGALAAIDDGLISYWNFNENAGTIANDGKGSNDGQLLAGSKIGTPVNGVAPSWVPGKWGSALSFDGISSYVNAGSDASLKPALVSVSAWVKADKYSYYGQIAGMATDTGSRESGYSILADDHWLSGTGDSFVTWISDTKITPPATRPDGNYFYTTDVPADPFDWTNVVATYDGTTVKLYVNGVEKASDSILENNGALSYDYVTAFYMGVYSTPIVGQTNWWLPYTGLIDDVAVWDRALTAGEVSWLSSNQIPEPATVALLGLGALGLVRRRRKG
jgi:hypothetical protein